jgi:tetratricopeptide (TPR) repeat protein
MKALKIIGKGILGVIILFVVFFVSVTGYTIISGIPAVSENDKGVAALNSGDLTTALADFNESIKTAPGVAKAYENRATVEIKMGDNTDGLADCNKALQLDPNMELAYADRGVLEGSTAAAMADLNKAIALNPKDDNAYDDRGVVKYNQGDVQGAIADLNQALAINPKNATASAVLAKIQAQSGTK